MTDHDDQFTRPAGPDAADLSPEHDELLARMRAADPIDAGALPQSDGPEALTLLETIMAPTPQTPAAGGTGRQPDPVLFGTDVPSDFGSARPMQRRGRRGFGLILASAAAIVLLVAGALALLPSNTEPALAVVQSAAQATATAESGRVEVTANLDGSDETGSGSIDAVVEGRYDGDDLAFSIVSIDADGTGDDFDGADLEEFGDEFPISETRYIDGVIYANSPEGWFAVEVPEFVGEQVTDLADPREVLATVQELVEATEVGTAVIDEPNGTSIETTHYQSVINLGDESLQESGWLAGLELTELDADGEVTVDLYVTDDLLRRLTVSGNAADNAGGEGNVTFEVVTSFYDFDGDISVEAPTDVEIVDPFAELQEGDFEFGPDEDVDG